MASKKPKKSRSSSAKKKSSGGSFRSGGLFGGGGGGLLPIFAIVCGVLIGMGGAYVVKRAMFGNGKKRSEVAMIEDGDRLMGRGRLKREARVRPVETADVTDDKAQSVPSMEDSLPVQSAEATLTPAPPLTAPVAPEQKVKDPTSAKPSEPVLPRSVTIRNLTFSRQLFNRCSEDCLLLFRTADGGMVKAKLKKSLFLRVLSSNSTVEIDGHETMADAERIIVVKSIRGMAVPPAP